MQKAEKFAQSSPVSMQTINKVYIVAEKVQTKFTSEVTKQLKKFTFLQKKFTLMQKKFTFFGEKFTLFIKKMQKSSYNANQCKLM